MISEIRRLEATARRLEPDAAERQRLRGSVLDYADHYLEQIASTPAYNARADEGNALYDSPITEEAMEIRQALALLGDHVDSIGINPTSGRFLGYVPGGGLFHAALGDYLAAITNRFAGYFFASPGAVRVENLLLRWMAEVIGYPAAAAGNLTSGGSLANLNAIVAARDDRQISGERIAKSVVYLTDQAHHSIQRALHIAGLDQCVTRKLQVDSAYRMDPQALAAQIVSDQAAGLNPWLVVAAAGTTNTGAVDPIPAIASIAGQYGLWLHVDGAYGAFFVLCPEGREVLSGMEHGDSLVMDPHKTLFLPYGIGAVLVKDGKKLCVSNRWRADYTQDFPERVEEWSPSELSPELTKHFRGLRLWLPLKVLGVAPFRAALSEKIHLARYFYEQVQRMAGFEVGPYPDLSIVTYRYVPARGDANQFNERLTQAIQNEGRVFVTSTRLDGKFVLRAAVSCFRTHLDDIDETLDILKRTAKRLAATE
jgi:aromatic-L-amino-acid decarboxylase